MPAPTQILVVSAANHNGTTPDNGSYSVDVLGIGTPINGTYNLLGVDVPAGAMVVPLKPLTQVVTSTVNVEAVGEEPVIAAINGNISISIASGDYAGTYETDYLGTQLSVDALTAGPLCLVRPIVSGETRPGDRLTIMPGLWIYGGPDPGDQTWQQQLDGSNIAAGGDLDYVVQAGDAGKTFTVRESFGGVSVDSMPRILTPFAPVDLAGLTAWFDATDATTLTATDGRVAEWRDKSGNAHHVTQANAARQPGTGMRSINGHNALDFPVGSLAYLERSDALGFTGNPAITVFVVAETDSLPANITAFAYLGRRTNPTGGACVYFTTGSDGYSWRHNNGNRVFRPAATGTAEVLTWSRGPTATYGTGNLRVNGGATATPTAVSNAGGTMALEDASFLVGNSVGPNGVTSSNGLDAAIAEILIYDTELSNADLDAVLGYLADKWSLSVSPVL